MLIGLIAAVVAAAAASPQTEGGAYTRYELLAPDSHKFRIVYEITATTPGATAYYNPGSIASDEAVTDRATGAPLKFAEVDGSVARAGGVADAAPGSRYIAVTLAHPVPDVGGGAALPGLLGPKTRIVAVGGASNALGTLNDIPEITAIVRRHSSALVFVDAVQLVPHVATDVTALGADLLVCSPYKFFGPHQGVLWGRAAVAGTIDYLDWLGGELSDRPNDRRQDRSSRLRAAMAGIAAYEARLGERFLAGLATIDGLRLYGPPTMAGRVPTFAFTIDGVTPQAIAAHLAAAGIFGWAGDFYAVEVVARLGLAESGGLVRLGLAHYSTAQEVDRTIAALATLVRGAAR